LPTETEIIGVKLIIQSEESALQKVEDALIDGQEAYDASVEEAMKLLQEEIAAIHERFDTQIQQMTVSWKQKEAELKTERRKIAERLARQREFVAPVKRLPAEVLSYILTIQVDCGDTPWTLLRVCRLWKVVTSSTPRTWRYIRITTDNQRKFDSGTSFQNCFTNAQFEKALARTGAAPLSVCFAFPPHVTDKVADSGRLFALFGTLTRVFDRCDIFELKETFRSFSVEYQELFATLQFPITSSLRCFRVGGGWEKSNIAQKILVASDHESTALRELSMATLGDSSLVFALTKHQILLKRLTSFSANGFEVPKDLCVAMRRLSYFSQKKCNFALSQAAGISDLLQEVQFLQVSLLELDTHQFGNLRKLLLRGCSMPIRPGTIKAPVLDTLIFQDRSWLPILMIDSPSLPHLELRGGPYSKTEAKKEVNQLWGPERGFIHLRTLKIDLVMSDAVLITILKRLVALELLSITLLDHRSGKYGMAPGDTFFNSFLVKNSQRSGFLQNLHTLILQCQYDYSKSDGLLPGLRTGLQRVVRSRQRSAPLRSVILGVKKPIWSTSEPEWVMISEEEFVVRQEE
jgi:hypothetical protein